MIKTIVNPIKEDNYGYMTNTNYNSVAYLRNYGRGFYLPGKNQQKQIKYQPIRVMRDAVLEDMDKIMEVNADKPDVLVSLVYLFCLNQFNFKQLFVRILENHLLLNDYEQISKLSPSKLLILIKCLRMIQLFQHTSEPEGRLQDYFRAEKHSIELLD